MKKEESNVESQSSSKKNWVLGVVVAVVSIAVACIGIFAGRSPIVTEDNVETVDSVMVDSCTVDTIQQDTVIVDSIEVVADTIL